MPRRTTALVVAAIALLVVIFVMGRTVLSTRDTAPRPTTDGQTPGKRGSPVALRTKAARDDPGCTAQSAALDDRLKASPDAQDAWQRLLLARGQAERIAGTPRAPGTPSDEAKVRQHAGDMLPTNATVESVDCTEWPCILLATYPNQEHPRPEAVSGSDIRTSSSWGARSVREADGTVRLEGTVHQTIATFGLAEGSNELSTRMRFRFQRARAESEDGFTPSLAPPSLPRAAPDDPCGRDASAIRWLLEDPEAATLWLNEAARYHQGLHAFMSGEVVASPEQLDPRYRETAVREACGMVADITGLELIDVDCTEHPCLASLAGRTPEGADIASTVQRLTATTQRALEEAGYPQDQWEVFPGSVLDTGELALWITLHPPGEQPDPKRASTRRDENGWPSSMHVFDPVD